MGREALKELIIRDLLPEDVPEILLIEQASFTTPWSGILFMNEIHKPGSLPKVAVEGGKISGYICANYVLDEGHILNVTVHPGFRRRGIAERLIEYMISQLSVLGCREIFLEVRASNIAAIRMYEKRGFRIITARKQYYTHPVEDAIIMSAATVAQNR